MRRAAAQRMRRVNRRWPRSVGRPRRLLQSGGEGRMTDRMAELNVLLPPRQAGRNVTPLRALRAAPWARPEVLRRLPRGREARGQRPVPPAALAAVGARAVERRASRQRDEAMETPVADSTASRSSPQSEMGTTPMGGCVKRYAVNTGRGGSSRPRRRVLLGTTGISAASSNSRSTP